MNTHPNDNVPLILITNDDGIESPGLVAAVDAARRVGRVVVAAPTTQQTARGRAMTGDREDYFHPVDLDLEQDIATGMPTDGPLYPVEAWHIDASPALVVRHALAVLCPDRRPDLVISGINYGENLGNNIMISGTVGAALQAAAQGIPAIAVSRQTEIEHHYAYQKLDWSESARVTLEWTRIMLLSIAASPENQAPFSVLKIDVPDSCTSGTETRLTSLSRQPYFRSRVEHPHRRTPLKAAQTFIEIDPQVLDPLDDIYALAVDRVVSITPLSLDCTAPMDPARDFFEAFSSKAV